MNEELGVDLVHKSDFVLFHPSSSFFFLFFLFFFLLSSHLLTCLSIFFLTQSSSAVSATADFSQSPPPSTASPALPRLAGLPLPLSVLTDSYKATHFAQYPDAKEVGLFFFFSNPLGLINCNEWGLIGAAADGGLWRVP